MASVIYNNSKLIPAPLIRIEKNYVRSGDRQKIGSGFTLTLVGKIFPCRGSPQIGGIFYQGAGYPPDELSTDNFHDVLTKYEAIRTLFAEDGKPLEIQTDSGGTPIKCYPTVQSISVPEEQWVQYMDYTIVLECPDIFGLPGREDFYKNEENFVDDDGNPLYLSEASENWLLEFNEQAASIDNPHAFRLQHALNAVGKQAYDGDGKISTGWDQARRWVVPRMGVDSTKLYATSGLNLPEYFSAYNHVRSENTDEYTGQYGITESWLISSGSFFEDFTISKRTSIENGLTNVGIDGTITGLETNVANAVSATKFSAAETAWSTIKTRLYDRVNAHADGAIINIAPLTTQVGKNPVAGTIGYTYEYDSRPSNFVAGALSEIVTIENSYPTDVFATIGIIGRAKGPILQDMNTITEKRQRINIEVQMPPFSGVFSYSNSNVVNDVINYSPKSGADLLINLFREELRLAPNNQIYKDTDTESWSPKTGKYNRTVQWTYQNC